MAAFAIVTVGPPAAGVAQQIWPIAGATAAGAVSLTLLNTSASTTVTLLDAAAKTAGNGFPIAPGGSWTDVVEDEEIWATVPTGSSAALAVSAVNPPQS